MAATCRKIISPPPQRRMETCRQSSSRAHLQQKRCSYSASTTTPHALGNKKIQRVNVLFPIFTRHTSQHGRAHLNVEGCSHSSQLPFTLPPSLPRRLGTTVWVPAPATIITLKEPRSSYRTPRHAPKPPRLPAPFTPNNLLCCLATEQSCPFLSPSNLPAKHQIPVSQTSRGE